MNNERIQQALERVETQLPRPDITLQQSAFNLLLNIELTRGTDHLFGTSLDLRVALENWADTVLGPENGSEERWENEGGAPRS